MKFATSLIYAAILQQSAALKVAQPKYVSEEVCSYRQTAMTDLISDGVMSVID